MPTPKQRLLLSVGYLPDASAGGIIATAMRQLANAAETATGATLIAPDGTIRYISRAEAERLVNGSRSGGPPQ